MNKEPATKIMSRVGVVGLGSMGLGMAKSCVTAGLQTWGFDVNSDRINDFVDHGGMSGDLVQVAPSLDCLILVVVNADQMESILFGDANIASKLKQGSVVMACPTVTPEYAKHAEQRLDALGIHYLDAPISGGSAKAATGQLTIMASGKEAAFGAANSVLNAMAETVYRLGDCAGPGSAMKIVNQLLAGVHIAATAEAMTFGIKQGIDAQQILDVLSNCAGTSWMFENRGPHIANGDYTPHSAVDIFVKDLGIVSDIARSDRSYTPLASAALQEFLAASGAGFGQLDDSAVAKIYARNAGIKLPGDA